MNDPNCRYFPAYFLFICGVLLIGLNGCFQKEYAQFNYQLDEEEVLQFYEPLIYGQEQLQEVLRNIDFTAEVVVLDAVKSSISKSFIERQLLDETNVVFFRVYSDGSANHKDTLYFNQKSLTFNSLGDFFGDAASSGVVSGELIKNGTGTFSIIRSIPVSGKDSKAEDRGIFRFDFNYDKQNGVTFAGQMQLSAATGYNFMPVAMPEVNKVIYLHRDGSGMQRLMVVGIDGQGESALLPEQHYNVRFPRRLADGSLLIAANPDEYYSLYTIDLLSAGTSSQGQDVVPPQIAPYTEALPRAQEPSAFVYANASSNGKFQPLLLELPPTYNLKSICTLVTAHNPWVNKMRALLAAALIEAGQARFANWPVLDWGIFYTPAVGVFLDEPTAISGDFLAESISRGILGLVQPLLNLKRNKALEKEKYLRAEIARDNVLNEINERIAEAAELYFEAQYLKKTIVLESEYYTLMSKRLQYYRKLRASSEATLEPILATEMILEGIYSEKTFHTERLAFLKNRLKEVCGLPEGVSLVLADEQFDFQEYVPESFDRMRSTALLHHPNLKAAKASLQRAFFLEQTGPKRRPTAFIGTTYGQSRRDFSSPVDDYITLALSGQYPIGSLKAKQEHGLYWQEMLHALRSERQAQADRVVNSLQEAILDFLAAQRDYEAKQSSQLYYLEKLRVARLYKDFGSPNESSLISPVTEINARFEYLQAMTKSFKTEMDLGLRFAKIWREMGLSVRLPVESQEWLYSNIQKQKASAWLWKTKEILSTDESMRQLIALCRTNNIRRIYAYLYSDSLLLESSLWREKIKLFVNFCARADIDVWALLGEPDWLENDTGLPALETAVERVLDFNRSLDDGEPYIRGIKLDLEPHSLPGWNSASSNRQELSSRYLKLIGNARLQVGDSFPLWADIPLQFFRSENQELLSHLTSQLSGATLMDYFNSERKIIKNGELALQVFEKPLEIGLELSPKAPETDRLPFWGRDTYTLFIKRLLTKFGSHQNFTGLALHDCEALHNYFGSWAMSIESNK